jgi:hypothetical protein
MCNLKVITQESSPSSIAKDVAPKTNVGNIIRGIHCNKNEFRRCSFHHINREANQAAHKLAGLAHEEPNKVWIEEDPPQIISILISDMFH